MQRRRILKIKQHLTGPLSSIKENVSAGKTICSTDEVRLGSICQDQGGNKQRPDRGGAGLGARGREDTHRGWCAGTGCL